MDGRDDVEPLFHLALADEWEAARRGGQAYRRSTVGVSLEEQGFVHCSFRGQVQPTADRFYAGRDDVVLLVVDPRRLTSPVRVEPVAGPGSERFPHVYGPIDLDAVVDSAAVPVGPDGRLDIAATGLAG
jgi:glutathione S-transferase